MERAIVPHKQAALHQALMLLDGPRGPLGFLNPGGSGQRQSPHLDLISPVRINKDSRPPGKQSCQRGTRLKTKQLFSVASLFAPRTFSCFRHSSGGTAGSRFVSV